MSPMSVRLAALAVVITFAIWVDACVAQATKPLLSDDRVATIEPSNGNDSTAAPLTTGGACTTYSNGSQVTGTLVAQDAIILASWNTLCTSVVAVSMSSVFGRYQVQIWQQGSWSAIFDSDAQGASAYLPNLPPGSYRIVGYNPQMTASSKYTLTYNRPLS